MTHSELKKKIIDKFGSTKRFAAIRGIGDFYELRLFLIRRDNNISEKEQADIDVLNDTVDETNKMEVPPNEIGPIDRIAMNRVIKLKFGNVLNFCKEYPEFKQETVYQILNGYRKRKTKIVFQLINTLEKCTK